MGGLANVAGLGMLASVRGGTWISSLDTEAASAVWTRAGKQISITRATCCYLIGHVSKPDGVSFVTSALR